MMVNKNDDAVSPVIGVMLMVVITVVIAGVIAAFGTGLVGNTEPAPSVVLDVEIINYDMTLDGGMYGSLNGPDFRITHTSGDALDTGDIELRFSWTDTNGVKHQSRFNADTSDLPETLYTEIADGPMMTVNGKSYKGIPFGEVELEIGMTLKSGAKFLGSVEAGDTQHHKSKYMDYIFNNGQERTEGNGVMDWLAKGTKVDVTILHIPSNTIIYDKAVYVK